MKKMKITASKTRYEMFYVDNYGSGTSMKEIINRADWLGMPNYYWASDNGNYAGNYNGDTIVIYDKLSDLPLDMREDARRHGRTWEDYKLRNWPNYRKRKELSSGSITSDRSRVQASTGGLSDIDYIKVKLFDYLCTIGLDFDQIPAKDIIEQIQSLSPAFSVDDVINVAYDDEVGIYEAVNLLEKGYDQM